jgi:AraC-like DNA-binding protein
MGASTLSSWALLIARALDKRQVDAEPLFLKAHVPFEALRDANARCPFAAIRRLWSLATEATGDPCFGLEVGRLWHPTSFHALGYSALASGTLREAFAYLARYCRVVSNGAQVNVENLGTQVVVKLTSVSPHPDDAAPAQAGLAAIAMLCRYASGDAVGPTHVHFMHRADGTRERVERFFGCPVAFGAASNALAFSVQDVDAPLPGANAALLRINEEALHRYAARIDSKRAADRVRGHLAHLLPTGEADQTRVARAMNVSLRSLQRKLREEGVTFRELLDDTRRRLAAQYAKDATLSSSEIAYLVGFSEPSSFMRAKRRWRRRARAPASSETLARR